MIRSLLFVTLALLFISGCSTASMEKFNRDYETYSWERDKEWDNFFDAVMQ